MLSGLGTCAVSELDVEGCDADADEVALARALRENTTIRRLNVDSYSDDPPLELITEALIGNSAAGCSA